MTSGARSCKETKRQAASPTPTSRFYSPKVVTHQTKLPFENLSLPVPSPRRGWDQTSTGDPKSPERSAVVDREATRRGDTAWCRASTKDFSRNARTVLSAFLLAACT